VLLLVAIGVGVATINLEWNGRQFIREGKLTMADVRRGATAGADYVETQTALFASDEYQERLKANLNVGSKATKFIDDLDKELTKKTLPKVNQNLDSSNAVLVSLRTATDKSGTFISNTDESLNQKMLPELTGILHGLRLLTENEVKEVVKEALQSFQNIRVITDDPKLKSLPADLSAFTEKMSGAAGKLDVLITDLDPGAKAASGTLTNIESVSKDFKDKFHSLLYPPPAPFLKRYILYPLKDAAGITYLFIKLANGL